MHLSSQDLTLWDYTDYVIVGGASSSENQGLQPGGEPTL